MRYAVSVLGELVVSSDGVVVPLRSRKQRALIGSLALRRGTPRTADALIDDLWGVDPPATARKNVQVVVGRLRSALGSPDSIGHVERGYVLDPARWDFDDESFERELREAGRHAGIGDWTAVEQVLDVALARWTGPTLGTLADEHWAVHHVRALDAEHRAAMLLRNEARLQNGNHERALIDLVHASNLHPEDLELRALLVRALHRTGRQAEALEQCRACLAGARRRGLERDVDRFRELEHRMLAQTEEFAVQVGPALPRVPVPRHELLGRTDELRRVRESLLNGSRLTTIVGPGGAGKTRLAAEVSLGIGSQVEDIAWIDLAPAATAEDVLATLLNAFGITSASEDPTGSLVQAMCGRPVLLVLDNFEQVVDSAPTITRLREECPELHVLVTSRTPLRVDMEDVVQLAPFDVPEHGDRLDPATLGRLDAIRLFYDRASLVDGIVSSSDASIREVHQLCARVDGLPLGIELAAARTRLLSPRDILGQLQHTFSLIASHSPERPERHRSIDSVIAWSYELLDDDERQAFRAMSLFVGGSSIEDFATVAGFADEPAARSVLERLNQNSLVVRHTTDGGTTRWRMLETIAAFGRERLAEEVGGDELRLRFAQCMLDHARASNSYAAHANGTEQRLIVERANVHAAFDWAVERCPEMAADIFIGMDRYLHTRGSMFEGDELGQRLRPHAESLDVRRRSLTLGLIGRMAHYAGDEGLSVELLERSIDLAHAHGLDIVEMRVRVWYVERLRMSGGFHEALEQAELARQLGERHEDLWHVALAMGQMGFACIDHEAPEDARRHFLQAREIFEDLGDVFWSLNMDVNLVSIELVETNDPSLLARLESIRNELARLEYWTYSAHAGSAVLRASLELGRFREAATYADTLLPRVRQTGETMMLMFTLACASVAYLEDGRRNESQEAAWESLVLAARTKGMLFVDYSLAMLACSVDDPGLARWIAQFIDLEYLDGMFALDRHLAAELERRVGTVESAAIAQGEERVGQLDRVISRVREADAISRA